MPLFGWKSWRPKLQHGMGYDDWCWCVAGGMSTVCGNMVRYGTVWSVGLVWFVLIWLVWFGWFVLFARLCARLHVCARTFALARLRLHVTYTASTQKETMNTRQTISQAGQFVLAKVRIFSEKMRLNCDLGRAPLRVVAFQKSQFPTPPAAQSEVLIARSASNPKRGQMSRLRLRLARSQKWAKSRFQDAKQLIASAKKAA